MPRLCGEHKRHRLPPKQYATIRLFVNITGPDSRGDAAVGPGILDAIGFPSPSQEHRGRWSIRKAPTPFPSPVPQNRLQHNGLQGLMFDVPGVHNGMLTIVFGGHRLITTERGTPTLGKAASADGDLNDAIRSYVRTYVLWHGRRQAAETLGVSRHTLWRFLERGHVGRAVPCAVIDAVGGSAQAIEAATRELVTWRPVRRRDSAPRPLPQELEDTLLLVCAAPLSTVGDLSRFGRVPASTLRDRLRKLSNRGLADSVTHRLSLLGPHPQRRYFPTEQGIDAGGMAEHGRETFLRQYPVSKEWFRLLADRLETVAALYRVAVLVADADPHQQLVRVDHYLQGPYDMLITLSGGRSVGLLRQGPTLPSANLRYRLRSMENLPSKQRPTVTLALTHSDQATRRAVRTLGHPMQHRATFVATEGELLAGDHRGVVWQQCGAGMGDNPPVKVVPGVSLNDIVRWTDRLLEIDEADRRRYGFKKPEKPTPDPEALYPSHLRATMPEPAQQLGSALAVQLTRAEKDALDLPGAKLPVATQPRAHRRPAPGPHQRRADIPGPPGPGRPEDDPGPLERPTTATPQRQSPGLRRGAPCAPSPPRWSTTTPSPASPPP